MSCAVRNLKRTEKEGAPFTDRYGALMRHYGMEAQHTQPRRPTTRRWAKLVETWLGVEGDFGVWQSGPGLHKCLSELGQVLVIGDGFQFGFCIHESQRHSAVDLCRVFQLQTLRVNLPTRSLATSPYTPFSI